MFMQVIQGPVSDVAEAKQALDDWADRLAPGAEGWLGSTAGVTDDGMFVAVARFESAQAARRNSDRPAQDEWWAATSKAFSGEVVFHDCSDVLAVRAGGSDEAGFVQVIQGRTTDVARMRQLTARFDAHVPTLRPDLLGFLVGFHDAGDGRFTQVAYFTSEDAARAGEQQEPPQDARELMEEEMALMQDVSYLDLRRPWLHSPR
jgi:hypothetical protein